MSGVTKQMLREELIALLSDTDKPTTAGDFTRVLNARGVDVRRSAVQTALERLCREGAASYVWSLVQRNGRWVMGRHYTQAVLVKKNDNPFEELEV